MRICIATSTFPCDPQDGRSAAGFFVRDFALALARARCQVHVFTQASCTAETSDPPEISVTRFFWWASDKRPSALQLARPGDLPPILSLAAGGALSFIRLARQRRFDCVLAMWAVPAGLWALAGATAVRTPYCVWALGSDIWDYGRRRVSRPLIRLILKNSLKNYADGLLLAKEVTQLGGTPCSYLPSSRRLEATVVSAPPKSAGPRFLFLGRWHSNKGVDVLLEAMALLCGKNVQTHLDVYGGGPLEGKLKRIIKRRALPDSAVTLHGYVGPARAAEVIQASDCVVIPSRIDSIPVILSDAVSLGKPVIVTSVGDMGDLLDRHRCGLTCPPNDPEALADAMHRFALADPESFRSGVAAAASIFDVDRAAETFLDDLRQLGIKGTGAKCSAA